jgi:tetratricopeptide (TPR) repeat protein
MAKAKKPSKARPSKAPQKKAAGKKAQPTRKAAVRPAEVVVDAEVRREGRAFPIEIDPAAVDATLARVKDELVHWANKGRYTRVRFKFRGKQLLPDLPLAAVVAAEGLTFYWGGILRALLMNVAGKSVLDVEFVNDSEKRVQKGKEELLSGNLDEAMKNFREALAMDRDSIAAHLNLGVSLKLKGDFDGARTELLRAKELAKEGPLFTEAERLLQSLPGASALSTVPRPATNDVPPAGPN